MSLFKFRHHHYELLTDQHGVPLAIGTPSKYDTTLKDEFTTEGYLETRGLIHGRSRRLTTELLFKLYPDDIERLAVTVRLANGAFIELSADTTFRLGPFD